MAQTMTTTTRPVPATRRVARMPIDERSLAQALGLPPNIRVIRAYDDPTHSGVTLILESDRLAPVELGLEAPVVYPVMQRFDDGHHEIVDWGLEPHTRQTWMARLREMTLGALRALTFSVRQAWSDVTGKSVK